MRVFSFLLALIFICVFCASISNIRAIKGIETNEDLLSSSSHQLKPCLTEQKHYVRIGGYPIGISIKAQGLIVVDICEVCGENVRKSPSYLLQSGDILYSVNGERVNSIYRLKQILSLSKDGVLDVEYVRNNQKYTIKINAIKDKNDGMYKLGLSLKEDVGGVGTMTFVTQDGKFAALGHHIQDADTQMCNQLDSGNIFDTSINGIVKGEKGKAGGLVADVNRLSKSIGDIEKNTEIGLYGNYTGEQRGDLYRIALKGEAKIGRAQILTTIDGTTPKFYDIEIVKVISQSSAQQKGMVISISDKTLLEKTGGIVQGMSGSPIVQNGILIGAVTHVFVQDPTRGYAVHARFMYDTASEDVDDFSENSSLAA